jgi:hypothetical protein
VLFLNKLEDSADFSKKVNPTSVLPDWQKQSVTDRQCANSTAQHKKRLKNV